MNPTTLYAGAWASMFGYSSDGMFKSTDGATTWTTINTGLTNWDTFSLAIDPVTPATIYAGTLGGVFESTDNGATWVAASTGLTDLNIFSLAVDPVTPATLFVGTAQGVQTGNEPAAVPAPVPAPVPTTTTTAVAVGGCTMQPASPWDPTLMLFILLSAGYLIRNRRMASDKV